MFTYSKTCVIIGLFLLTKPLASHLERKVASMKCLIFFLRNAHDFMEGSRSVESLRAYYHSQTVEAEKLWEGLFTAEKKPHEFDEFCRLLSEGMPLYIQNETRKKDPFDCGKNDPVKFSIRVYPYANTRVPVLRTDNLPC